jgi:hypothetical protein
LKPTKLERLTDRVTELEKIVAENRRPPTRLGNTLRFIVANIQTLEQIVEKHKNPNGKTE